MANVIMYTTPTCGWCRRTKDYFQEHNVSYIEKDVSSDSAARAEMFEKSGQMGVPVITIDDDVVVGFNQPALAQLLGL